MQADLLEKVHWRAVERLGKSLGEQGPAHPALLGQRLQTVIPRRVLHHGQQRPHEARIAQPEDGQKPHLATLDLVSDGQDQALLHQRLGQRPRAEAGPLELLQHQLEGGTNDGVVRQILANGLPQLLEEVEPSAIRRDRAARAQDRGVGTFRRKADYAVAKGDSYVLPSDECRRVRMLQEIVRGARWQEDQRVRTELDGGSILQDQHAGSFQDVVDEHGIHAGQPEPCSVAHLAQRESVHLHVQQAKQPVYSHRVHSIHGLKS